MLLSFVFQFPFSFRFINFNTSVFFLINFWFSFWVVQKVGVQFWENYLQYPPLTLSDTQADCSKNLQIDVNSPPTVCHENVLVDTIFIYLFFANKIIAMRKSLLNRLYWLKVLQHVLLLLLLLQELTNLVSI